VVVLIVVVGVVGFGFAARNGHSIIKCNIVFLRENIVR
jgi:hypothetical protein